MPWGKDKLWFQIQGPNPHTGLSFHGAGTAAQLRPTAGAERPVSAVSAEVHLETSPS